MSVDSHVNAASNPWHVFYTRPRAEKKCEQQLKDHSIEVFLPKRTVVRQWSDRRKKVSQPLFQNYIFARVSEQERIAVLRTLGIVRCVAFDGRPATITPDEIHRLRIMQLHPEWLVPVDAPLPGLGSEIRIDAGPLRGLSGVVTEHRGDTHLVVQIPSIKQAVKVIIPAGYAQTSASAA